MLDAIIRHDVLCNHLIQECQENGIRVVIGDSLLDDGMLDTEKILIIKPDSYYSSARMATPPPSIDCIIITKCADSSYKLYLVEMRDRKGAQGVSPKVIIPKFRTIVEKFFADEFKEIFNADRFHIRDIKMWIVTDAYNTKQCSEEAYIKKIKGTVLDNYLSQKPFRVFGKLVLVEPIVPYLQHVAPVIQTC
jgi:hypothetical protein